MLKWGTRKDQWWSRDFWYNPVLTCSLRVKQAYSITKKKLALLSHLKSRAGWNFFFCLKSKLASDGCLEPLSFSFHFWQFRIHPVTAPKAGEVLTPCQRLSKPSSASILGEQSWILVFLRVLHLHFSHTSVFLMLIPSDHDFGVILRVLFLLIRYKGWRWQENQRDKTSILTQALVCLARW